MSAANASSLAPEAIPHEATKRLLQHFRTFVQTSRDALKAGLVEGTQRTRWGRASGLLERELQALEQAARQAESGTHAPLILHASRLRFLAKRMDGYRLDFAGPEVEERLVSQRRLIVLVAWQIFAFASGSKASGL